MKRIAIFCDGTWNSPTIPEVTHVRELFLATEQSDSQLPRYFDGVGNRGPLGTRIDNAIFRIGGGAFGWGLNRKIKEAYAYCASNYAPDDEILIFGFSRGAYTARSLAGMIRKCGFPDEITRRNVNRAFRLYRRPGNDNAPDEDHVMQARRELSPRFATSDKDMTWRNDGSHRIKITYVGVWDTVGALGIPEVLLGPLAKIVNARHQFHDTALSSTIHRARHALALDERRQFFPPALWKNLDKLARGIGESADAIKDDRRYQQMWFVGDHGTVGGTGEVQALNAVTLDWIADGARDAGLEFKPGVQFPKEAPDPAAGDKVGHDRSGLLLDWREGPERAFELSKTVNLRLDARPDYRPRSLRRILPDLF